MVAFYFFKLCWKNIWRNKRRTMITANAIAVGVMALVAMRNYYDGLHDQIVQNAIACQSGHLVLQAPGYEEHKTLALFMKDTASSTAWLSKQPQVKAWSERIFVPGLLSSAHGSANIAFVGVEPDREKQITRFSASLTEGNYLDKAPAGQKSIVIGSALSKLLKAPVGTKLVALTQGADGSIGNELMYVAGIFETQSDADRNIGFVSLSDARVLSSLPAGAAHQIAVVLKGERQLPEVLATYAKGGPNTHDKPEMLSWMDTQRPVMAVLELDNAVNRLLMIIVLFVAAMGIANSILMSVMERTRECAVMMAIGTTKREVIGMVVLETFLLSLVGVALGNAMGIALTEYFGKIGFDLRWLTSHELVINGAMIQTVSYPHVLWHNCVSVSLVILGLSLIVSVLPARFIGQMRVVKALRAI